MTNFNAQAFMASLTAEMQEKVKACKTPDELQALADANNINLADFSDSAEEDVELSLEDLENVGGGKGVAPIALAAIMLLSSAGGLLSGCSSTKNTNSEISYSSTVNNETKPTEAASETDDMARDDTEEKAEDMSIHTAYNKAGSYSVSFGESDLIFAKDSKEASAEILNLIEDGFTLDQVQKDDIKVQYSVVTYPEAAEGAEEAPEPTYELREATINSFANDGTNIGVAFTDPDAAENKTGSYVLYIEKMGAVAVVSADFADHTLTADTTTVASTADGAEFKITAAEGSFAEGISKENITLEGSFKEMSVESVSASGNALTVKLSGSPVLEEDICTTYTAGIITVNAEGFENGISKHSVCIDVAPPSAFIDQSGLEFSDGKLTVPMQLSGIDAASIGTGDVQFEDGVTVTDVQKDGDDRILVTVEVDGATDLASAVDAIADQQTVVGEAEMFGNVAHASFYPFFDYVEQDGDNLKFTLKLQVSGGTVSDGISADMVTLADGFMDGKVESIKKNSDTEAELIVSVPANGNTAEEYSISGTVALAEGALVDEWGEAAPACKYNRLYTPDEMGRMSIFDAFDIGMNYTAEKLTYVSDDAAKVARFGKDTYTIVKGLIELDGSTVWEGAKDLLTIAGLIRPDNTKSDTELLREDMQNINNLLHEVNGKLDETMKAVYNTRLVLFDSYVDDMATYAGEVQGMYNIVMQDPEKYGITAPADDASAEEYAAFTEAVTDAIEAQEKAGNKRFKGFTNDMEKLKENYINATNQIIRGTGDQSPFYYYDELWTMYYNWETQAYYQRLAYRTNVEYQITNAYNLMAVYYNLAANPTDHNDLSENLTKAIDEIEKHPAGFGPYDVTKGKKVYSYSLCRSMNGIRVGGAPTLLNPQDSMYDLNP